MILLPSVRFFSTSYDSCTFMVFEYISSVHIPLYVKPLFCSSNFHQLNVQTHSTLKKLCKICFNKSV